MKETTVPAPTDGSERQIPGTREESRTLAPPVDIFETAEGLTVVADLPGVEKDDIEVRVEKDVLTLRAKAKSLLPERPLHREYELLNFFRQFQLADTVDQDHIKAEMKHGVLVIRMPKKEERRPKQIQVRVTQ